MSNDRYDLIVLGSGPAASRVAMTCAETKKVALIDDPVGGTCALRGCHPKKVFTLAAEIFDEARRVDGLLIALEGIRIDWPSMVQFKRKLVEPIPENSKEKFTKAGITVIEGLGRFVGRDTVEVNGQRVSATNILIATGARPVPLDIPGAELMTTSDEFMELDALPERVVFVGGGYISLEFAHVAARAGARVTILDRSERPLEQFEPELVGALMERTESIGAKVVTNAQVEAIERTSDGLRVITKLHSERRSFPADLVVHGAGRVPNIMDLNLDEAGVDHGPKGVKVDEYLRSVSNPSVYAAGDCSATGQPLTPAAQAQGKIVAANLLEGDQYTFDNESVPTVVFTTPALAGVGLSEKQAHERGLKFIVNQGDMSTWSEVRKVGESCAAYKVLIERGTDRILGAHIVGPRSEEVINLFAIAMQAGITASELKEMPLAFPTFGDNVHSML